jgi:hypothetical protein
MSANRQDLFLRRAGRPQARCHEPPYTVDMTRRGNGLLLLGTLALLGSSRAAIAGATSTMTAWNVAMAGVLLLWGATARFNSR